MESSQFSEKDYKWQLRNGWIPDEDYVFVSYSSRDWDKVYPCVMALRARGINVYIDIEFMENQSSSWLKNFQERLFRDSSCKGIVTFLSINYMRSYACLVEQMANRTNRMRRHAGKRLPVFYVALDPALSTLQQMSAYIYSDPVRRESTKERVEISPPEYTVLQKFILDSNLDAYRDADSVQELLDDIHDKHDVVINMFELIFSNPKDMPNIQLFEGVEQCVQVLTDNFVNDKNNSIKLPILEDLKADTAKRLRTAAPDETPLQAQNGRESTGQRQDSREQDSQRQDIREPDGQGQDSQAPDGQWRDNQTADGRGQDRQASDGQWRDNHAADGQWQGGQGRDGQTPDDQRQDEQTPDDQRQSDQTSDTGRPGGSEQYAKAISDESRAASREGIISLLRRKLNKPEAKLFTKSEPSPDSQRLCKQCKAPLRPGKKFCSKCGTKID